MKNIKCNIRDITYLLNSIKYTFIYEYTDFDDIEDFLIYDNDISHSNIPEDLLISLYHKYTHVSDSDYHINTEEHFHKCGIYLKLLLNGNYKESAVIEETVIVKTFTAELEHLLNKYDINNDFDISDSILAKYIVDSLKPLSEMINSKNRTDG